MLKKIKKSKAIKLFYFFILIAFVSLPLMTSAVTGSEDPGLFMPDLYIKDLYIGDDDFVYVKYCNDGGNSSSQSYIKIVANNVVQTGYGSTNPVLLDIPPSKYCYSAKTYALSSFGINDNYGDVRFYANIDPNYRIREIKEYNNAFTKTLSLGNEQSGVVLHGQGRYTLNKGDRISPNGNVSFEPQINSSNFTSVRFAVYDGVDMNSSNLIGYTDYVSVGSEKMVHVNYADNTKALIKINSIGSGQSVNLTFYSRAYYPVVENVSADNSGDGVRVKWTSDQSSPACHVHYGLSSGSLNYKAAHSTRTHNRRPNQYESDLTNLLPTRTYYYKVLCKSSNGATTESDLKTFFTLSSTSPPTIENIQAAVDSHSVNVSWRVSDQYSCSFAYSKNNTLAGAKTITKSGQSDGSYYNYNVSLLGLDNGSKYYYKISCSKGSQTIRSDLMSFNTLGSSSGSDLIITGIRLIPNTTTPSASQQVGVTVKNSGNTSANVNGSDIRLYLNKKNDSSGSGTVSMGYGFGDDGVLSPNETKEYVFNGTQMTGHISLSSNTTYYLNAYVDDNRVVSETNEQNNLKTATLTTEKFGNDLIVQNIELISNTTESNKSQKVAVTVKNSGNKAVDISDASLELYVNEKTKNCSASDTSCRGTISMGHGFSSDNILDAGEVRKYYFNKDQGQLTSYISLESGSSYFLTADVDSTHVVPELNEHNNSKTMFVQTESYNEDPPTGEKPDLIITGIRLIPNTTTPSASQQVGVTVKNSGNTSANVNGSDIRLYLNKKNDSSDSGTVSMGYGFGDDGVLSPNETKEYVFNGTQMTGHISLSSNTTYYLNAYVDDNRVVSETNEQNNLKTATLTTESYGDNEIAIDNLEVDASTRYPNVSWTISDNYSCALTYGFVRDLSDGISYDGQYGKPSGDVYSYNQIISKHRSAVIYYYKIDCNKDGDNITTGIKSFPKGDNIYYPDLVIDDISLIPGTSHATRSQQISVTVMNSGDNFAFIGPSGLTIESSSCITEPCSGEFLSLGDHEAVLLPNGGKRSFVFNESSEQLYLDSNMAYELTAEVDPDNKIDETNENNNTKTVTVKTEVISEDPPSTEKPDLVITDIYYDGKLKATYCNQGTGVSSDTFYIKTTAKGKIENGKSKNALTVPSPGQCATTSGYERDHFGLHEGGSYDIFTEIDWENSVSESSENNNMFSKQVQIGEGPPEEDPPTGLVTDLVVDSIVVEKPSVVAEDKYIINVNVRNVGNKDTDVTHVSLYVVADTDGSKVAECQSLTECGVSYAASVPLGMEGPVTLGYNDTKSITFNQANFLADTIDFEEGETYYIRAMVDFLRITEESDESNNNKTVSFKDDGQGDPPATDSVVDLVIESIDTRELSDSSEGSHAVDVLVKNIGDKSVNLGGAKLFITADANSEMVDQCVSTSGCDVGYVGLSNFGPASDPVILQPGGSTTVVFNRANTLTDSINFTEGGTYYIKSIIDFYNVVDESIETNNTKTATYQSSSNPGNEDDDTGDNTIGERLKGRLLLATEDKGRIYYIYPEDAKKYEVTFGNVMNLFQTLSLGISNADIYKIMINPNAVSNDKDSDGDGFSDKVEVQNGYNPDIPSDPNNIGNDRVVPDATLANRLIGKLLLQVENNGRIWYVDQNAKRWEVTFGNVMNLFTSLSLGISNSDLATIPNGN